MLLSALHLFHSQHGGVKLPTVISFGCRCMASSLVRTGFVRGSMTQGNGCYQHRCINSSLEVWYGVSIITSETFP
jgi:hypothetical protein